MRPALVIIDMQKDFFKRDELSRQKAGLVNSINSLVSKFREHDLLVVWMRQIWKPDLSDAHPSNRKSGRKMVTEGTEGSEFVDGLDIHESDHLVTKKRYSGFFKTSFEELLQKLKVDTLVVCGINTHACVRMTVIDAYQRDYEVIVAKDGVGSYDKQHHEVTLRYFSPKIARLKTNSEIFKLIK